MKSKIIIVGGCCATGKSTFAEKMSAELNIPCFIKDKIKENLGDGFGPDNDMVFNKGSMATFSLMLHITEQFIKNGKVCILEGNFKSIEIEKIEALLEKYNCECITYLFKGDFDILFKRYMKRDKAGKRHWVHQTSGETIEDFEKGHLRWKMGEIGLGQIITVDSTEFENIDFEKLINIGREFISS
ncbi:MAG: hypothetical protein LBC96_02595 [Lachnospiraceae bacterium]|jgi:predicted kinase|nr:hypothetical protein [Lachnospiraceae bacterium]